MKTLSGFLLLGGLVCASHQGYAGSDLDYAWANSDLRYFASVTLGAGFINTGHTQTLSLLPPFFNHYTSDTSYQISSLPGLELGIEQEFTEGFYWQLGLSGYVNGEVSSKGHVWEFALPDFDNFIYDYRIQSKRLMATGKLLGTVTEIIHPYVSGEVGAGFNLAKNYTETALIIEELPMAPFSDRTQISIAWGVGIGLDVDINSSLRLGLGYQFADLGKVSLGVSPAQLTQQTPSLPNLYSQEVRFQLTALI